MSLLWTSPAGPLLVLIVGAFVLMIVSRRRPLAPAVRITVILTGIALLLWALLRLQPALDNQLWEWHTYLGFETTLGIQLDGWAWLAGLGVLLLLFVGVALPQWHVRYGILDGRQWAMLLAAGALLAVLSSTWIALLAAWALMVLLQGFVAGSDEAASAHVWTVGILSMGFLLAVPLINGAGTFLYPLGDVQLNPQAQLLLLLATVFPLGAYPFHLWLVSQARLAPGRYLLIHIIPAVVALHLLGRFELPLLSSQAWVPLSVAALLGSAIAAWLDPAPSRSWAYVLINRATWALLVVGVVRLPAPVNVLFPLLTVVFGASLWAIARISRWQYRWNLPFLLSLAVLYGFPLTPGFLPTTAVGWLAGTVIGLSVWLLILLSQTLFVAALLRGNARPPVRIRKEATSFSRPILLALVLVVGLSLWWGLIPASVAELAGISRATFNSTVLSVMTSIGWAGWLTFLLPLLLGFLLSRFDTALFGALRGWQETLARVAGLEWLYGVSGRVLRGLAVATGAAADLVDGAGQFGWVLLAILIALILFSG